MGRGRAAGEGAGWGLGFGPGGVGARTADSSATWLPMGLFECGPTPGRGCHGPRTLRRGGGPARPDFPAWGWTLTEPVTGRTCLPRSGQPGPLTPVYSDQVPGLPAGPGWAVGRLRPGSPHPHTCPSLLMTHGPCLLGLPAGPGPPSSPALPGQPPSQMGRHLGTSLKARSPFPAPHPHPWAGRGRAGARRWGHRDTSLPPGRPHRSPLTLPGALPCWHPGSGRQGLPRAFLTAHAAVDSTNTHRGLGPGVTGLGPLAAKGPGRSGL